MATKVGVFHRGKVEFGNFVNEFVFRKGRAGEHTRVSFRPEGSPTTLVDVGKEFTIRFEEEPPKNHADRS